MRNIILIYANCKNLIAKGDFMHAVSIARELQREIEHTNQKLDIILTSTRDGMPRFASLGLYIDGKVITEDHAFDLCSLEEIDPITNKVVAFIEARHCKSPSSDLVRSIILPDSKYLCVDNANGITYDWNNLAHITTMMQVCFNVGFQDIDLRNTHFTSTGLGPDCIGLPNIKRADELPALNDKQRQLVPRGSYGFMYFADPQMIFDQGVTQYMQLTGEKQYVLVGNFKDRADDINLIYSAEVGFKPPKIYFYESLENITMRKIISSSSPRLVGTSGIMSTLELFKEKKLPYYEYLTCNAVFVTSYLLALHSICSNLKTINTETLSLVRELADLLFSSKPLSQQDFKKTQDLLANNTVTSRLIQANQRMIEQAQGKIAPRLLSFITSPAQTQKQQQLYSICSSLRKDNEKSNPAYDVALRRAATWNRLFHMKVLLQYTNAINERSKEGSERSALHWAVHEGHVNCVRLLISENADLDIRDKDGKTPLHYAIKNGMQKIISLLLEAGASLEIQDNKGHFPIDEAKNESTKDFVNQVRNAGYRLN